MRMLGKKNKDAMMKVSFDKAMQLKSFGATKQLCVKFNDSDRPLKECPENY